MFYASHQKIHTIAELDQDPEVALRIIVEPGGCHGYMYKLEITSGHEEDDLYAACANAVYSRTKAPKSLWTASP